MRKEQYIVDESGQKTGVIDLYDLAIIADRRYVSNDAHALKALGYNLPEIREEFIGVRGKGQKRLEEF